MPRHLSARPPLDAAEEGNVRKLSRSVHGPADWIFHAQIVAHSWDGLRTRSDCCGVELPPADHTRTPAGV